MRQISSCRLLGLGSVALVVFALASTAWAAGLCFRCKIQPVNLPVSLAVGTVRTPEFFVKSTNYSILIRVKRGLPLGQLECMMGITQIGGHDHCATFHDDTVLGAEWSVWDGEKIVAQGTIQGKSFGGYTDDTLDRSIGTFSGEANKRYFLEVKFTKDGTPLNDLKPRLIVQMSY